MAAIPRNCATNVTDKVFRHVFSPPNILSGICVTLILSKYPRLFVLVTEMTISASCKYGKKIILRFFGSLPFDLLNLIILVQHVSETYVNLHTVW